MVAYQPIAIITYYLNIFQKSIIIIYHQKSISLESLSLWDILFIIRTSEMQQWASITAIILPSSSGKIKSVWKILLPTHLWQVETLPKTKQVWGFFFVWKKVFCLKKSAAFQNLSKTVFLQHLFKIWLDLVHSITLKRNTKILSSLS